MDDMTVVLCTVPTEESAEKIARALVEERLAACVSIVPGIRSIYRWENEICDDPELLLLIKTRRDLFEPLSARLQRLHPYEVPEIVALESGQVSPAFLDWLVGATELEVLEEESGVG